MAIIRCSSVAFPYPNESLYGWLSRIGLLSQSGTDIHFLEQFMGYSGQQLSSMFPSFVKELSEFSGIAADRLIHEHSLLPYFRPYTDTFVYEHIVESLCCGGCQNAFSQFSLLANRIPERKELFYCPHCVIENIDSYGVAYWHIKHQLPWVTVCTTHESRLIGRARKRDAFELPPQSVIEDAHSSYMHQEELLLAISSECLWELNQALLNSDRVKSCYLTALKKIQLTSDNGQVRQEQWRDSLQHFWEPCLPSALSSALFRLKSSNAFPANIIYQAGYQHHPVKHLLVIIHLFNGIEEFLNCYFDEAYTLQRINVSPVPVERVEKQKVIRLINSFQNDQSLRQAAKEAGVSVGFAKATAIQNGFEIERRAQKLFAHERKQILDWLSEGVRTQDIAKKMECSLSAVEQLLTQSPSLKIIREKLRFYAKRCQHRQAIIEYLEVHKSATRGQVQKCKNASYMWCFKNDNKWLYLNLPPEVPRAERRIKMNDCNHNKFEKLIGHYFNEKDKAELYASLINMFGDEDAAIHWLKTYSISALGSVTAVEACKGNNATSFCRYIKMKELGGFE